MSAPRWTIAAALALLALAAALAGCLGEEEVSPNEAAPDAVPEAESESLPGDLAMEEAEVLSRNASSVTFRWESTMPASAGRSAEPVTSQLDVPQGLRFAIDAEMAWEENTELETTRIVDLRVQDAETRPRCGDIAGIGIALVSVDASGPPLRCQAPYNPPLETAEPWTVLVESIYVPQPTDFTLTLTLSLVPDEAVPDPALPEAQAGEANLTFEAPVSVDPQVPQHEPVIDVAPDGTIYVSGYVDRPGLLWRSTDDGASFERIDTGEVPYCNLPQTALDELPPAPVGLQGPDAGEFTHPGCGDTDLAAGEDGTVYWTQHYGGEAVAASHDAGDTWTTAVWASNEPAVTDRQWLATDGGEKAWLVFNSPRRVATDQAERGGVAVSRTSDGGTTWRQVGAPAEEFVIPGEITYDASRDRLLLSGPTDEGPAVALSEDGGETWSSQLVAERSGRAQAGLCYVCGIMVSADVDQAGNVYVTWVDPSDGSNWDVWLARSSDGGETWSTPLEVNAIEGTHVMPWISAAGDGEVALAWYGTARGGNPETLEGAWYVHAAATEEAMAAEPTFTEDLVSPHPIQFGPICLAGSGCGDARNLGDFFELALDEDGKIHVAYTNGRAGGAWNTFSRVLYAQGSLET